MLCVVMSDVHMLNLMLGSSWMHDERMIGTQDLKRAETFFIEARLA